MKRRGFALQLLLDVIDAGLWLVIILGALFLAGLVFALRGVQ